MGSPTCLISLLILAMECAHAEDSFFISAPNVFHVGVRERVFVHLGGGLLNRPVTLYLEHELTGLLMSTKTSTMCTEDGQVKTVELEIKADSLSKLPGFIGPPYLLLVGEVPSVTQRKSVRVLVSQHRGYIFIQTDQPIYNPTQKVNFRIFTLNHSMRPHNEAIDVSIYNAAGNRIKTDLVQKDDGLHTRSFDIPDVSEMGTWRIVAHYQGDEKNAATREFQVKKFVLPSFEVTVQPEEDYLLLNLEKFTFTISAMYSYGQRITGAYHCRVGVKEIPQPPGSDGKTEKIVFIRGLELTGPTKDGQASADLEMSRLKERLREQLNTSLSEMEQSGAQLYMAVSVTDIISGELQEAEVSLPIVSQRYSIDLSRTRSQYIPGVSFDAWVLVRFPNGSPATGVSVEFQVAEDPKGTFSAITNQQGAVRNSLNVPTDAGDITVQVTVDGHQQSKVVTRASSPSNSYLSISVAEDIQTVGESLGVDYRVLNGQPKDGFIYYMVFSRGVLSKHGSVQASTVITSHIQITHDMTPSFRLIGFYYHQNGDIIADSAWVDVKTECEGKIKVSGPPEYSPVAPNMQLTVDLEGQRAKVALLVVDKAIYALNAQNKLTLKQVFSSMQSYDLGCSYGGGPDTASVLNDAGVSFISPSNSKSKQSRTRTGFGCESGFRRQRRSLDLQQEMMTIKSNYTDVKLQQCCTLGFTLVPMRRSCEERGRRVSLAEADPDCVQAFLECCRQGEKLRALKRRQDAHAGFGRTASEAVIEEFFFDTSIQNIRRSFPPSFGFVVIDVNGQKRYDLPLPNSITTWEVQAISWSTSHGICVADPHDVRVFKNLFVSLRLPYSVKQYEQLSIVPVIYNYGSQTAELSVHMAQSEGLCSPGSASSTTYVNVTVEGHTSRSVAFSAVPMVTGEIPVTVRVYDRVWEMGLDAIQKILHVRTEGIEEREEETLVLDFNERSSTSITIDGELPSNSIPGSSINIFTRMEGEEFGQTTAKTLLSPEGVASLLRLPDGCAEQTMKRMAPTALALRYLDLTQRWHELDTGSRDTALHSAEEGYMRILNFKKEDGSYGAWTHWPSSYWLTGLVVKVMSLVAERQNVISEEKGRTARVVSEEEINHSVTYLLSKQNADGSFVDPNPVIHREMQGGVGGTEADVSTTAFITLALKRSLHFLSEKEKTNAEAKISKSTAYLRSRLESLKRPYAVAITAYCLSVCLTDRTLAKPAWEKLKPLATKEEGGCRVWRANADIVTTESGWRVPGTDAITVETTAYALLTAVAHGDSEWADSATCWLISQENYGGGFKSTQDTIVALEALSEYALSTPPPPVTKVEAAFTVPGKSGIYKLSLENNGVKVETELRKLIGHKINVQLTGQGKAKMKIVKAYHLMEPRDNCEPLSIKVTVEGKVEYTAKVTEDYNYYGEDYGGEERREEEDVPRSAIEWFDARTRYRRDTGQSLSAKNDVYYHVCVSHSLSRNLSGMGIADITLLSGFEAQTEDLDKLKDPREPYISHYEASYGRVLLYFNEMLHNEECISFGAVQRVPVGLLQPVQASYYDYYEPDIKCTVFYSAPQRSKMVSTLCTEDVCQCAERPCHKEKKTFDKPEIKQRDRQEYACHFPVVDYGYIVEVVSVTVKSNFELYSSKVTKVLRANKDIRVMQGQVRVFAKRLSCKGQLHIGKEYLIMGKDGLTTDSDGQMQYLLESTTWIEQVPAEKKCAGKMFKKACRYFNEFVSEYEVNGCTQ